MIDSRRAGRWAVVLILLAWPAGIAPAAAGPVCRDPALASPGRPLVLEPGRRRAPQPAIATVLAGMTQADYEADLSGLVGAFASRYAPNSDHQAVANRIRDDFAALGVAGAHLAPFTAGSATYWNVIAPLPGRQSGGRFVLIGAHFDSTSEQAATVAPGANDNGSGVAVLYEAARALVGLEHELDILLVAFDAEEIGLLGSEAYASELVDAGLDGDLEVAIILDMVSWDGGGTMDVLLETSSAFSGLTQEFGSYAADYTALLSYVSLNPFGSDHMPFLNRSLPALLLIENDWASYPHYHRSTDVLAEQQGSMGLEVARLAVAAALERAVLVSATATPTATATATATPTPGPATPLGGGTLLGLAALLGLFAARRGAAGVPHAGAGRRC